MEVGDRVWVLEGYHGLLGRPTRATVITPPPWHATETFERRVFIKEDDGKVGYWINKNEVQLFSILDLLAEEA
jgi:hypothetical protein